MVVSDSGHLVTLLADRASRREWAIIRVFEHDPGAPPRRSILVRSVHLDQIPGLPEDVSRVRVALDRRALRVFTSPPLEVSINSLEALGRVAARRRRWPR